MSDGYIGCGRRQPDGSGGNGHALAHFEATGSQYPLCVKLGTITPKGGDVYSYAPDENDLVENPNLAKHLAHVGINMMTMEKTEKTMAELNIDHNKECVNTTPIRSANPRIVLSPVLPFRGVLC